MVGTAFNVISPPAQTALSPSILNSGNCHIPTFTVNVDVQPFVVPSIVYLVGFIRMLSAKVAVEPFCQI